MSGDCDPIIVAGDDAMILANSDDRQQCEHCDKRFDPRETPGVFNGSQAFYQCPHCRRTTEA